jgi:hypothetical protein
MEQRIFARLIADSIHFFLKFEHFGSSVISPTTQRILPTVTVRDLDWHFFAIFDRI